MAQLNKALNRSNKVSYGIPFSLSMLLLVMASLSWVFEQTGHIRDGVGDVLLCISFVLLIIETHRLRLIAAKLSVANRELEREATSDTEKS